MADIVQSNWTKLFDCLVMMVIYKRTNVFYSVVSICFTWYYDIEYLNFASIENGAKGKCAVIALWVTLGVRDGPIARGDYPLTALVAIKLFFA